MHLSNATPSSPVRPAPAGGQSVRRVLILGDADGAVAEAASQAVPGADLISLETPFDALAHLATVGDEFDLLLAPAGSIGAAEAGDAPVAGRALREQLGEATVLLLGGDDDPLAALPATPTAGDLRRLLTGRAEAAPISLPHGLPSLSADDVLTLVTDHAGRSVATATTLLSSRLPAGVMLELADGNATGLHAVVRDDADSAKRRVLALRMVAPPAADERDVLQHELDALAKQLGRLQDADDRYARLRQLALFDELTGCHNRRYFRSFLDRILAKARQERFPVTLLLFDLDNFKAYNDQHGHATGDAILKQAGQLIRRCVRDHDFVARIGGDEFAVVFWEKDAPGSADASFDGADHRAANAGKPPRGPLQIAARFRREMNSPEFAALGETGVGSLSISGGMAVYPYDAPTADALIEAADGALVFGAKRSGKNSIALVGD